MPIDIERIANRPEDCVFAFGHVFYCLDSTVYFSQLLDANSFSKLGKCYSINDPTAETFNSPLDTDGGTIQISEASRIKRMERLGPGIICFAENGIWYIGGPDSGWKPTSFSVDRVSESGIISPDSVILVENQCYYWSSNSIHRLSLNEFNVPSEEILTDASIKTFYQQISNEAKRDASANYDSVNKQIGWTYYPDAGTEQVWFDFGYNVRADRMTHELIYDLRLDAWYPQEYKSFTNAATGSNDPFSISHGFELDISATNKKKRYLRVQGGQFTNVVFGFCGESETIMYDGEDTGLGRYPAYIETAYETLGNPGNRKAAHHITSFFNKTETAFVDDGAGNPTYDFPSGCQLTIKWDWAKTIGGNKWVDIGQVYRFRRWFTGDIGDSFDDGEAVIQTKTKLRGTGKAMSLRFEGEDGKQMELLGFTVSYEMAGRS